MNKLKAEQVRNLANRLYNDISQRGLEGIKYLFSKGSTLASELRFDENEEYVKKMVISQMNVEMMLFTHKYKETDLDMISEFRRESEYLRRIISNNMSLKFDDRMLDSLFGNSFGIKTQEEYEHWRQFLIKDKHGEKRFDTIFFEEEFKHNFKRERSPLKIFFQSFKYNKIMSQDALEDPYSKKIRDMFEVAFVNNPDDFFRVYKECHFKLEKGIEEYVNSRVLEDIARMTLDSLKVEQDKPLDIEETCRTFRKEITDTTTIIKMGTEYRQKENETTSTDTNIESTVAEKIQESIRKLQEEYEYAYNNAQTDEEYIRDITKIYMDFICIQPYQDGNKRTAICLFNSMLLSKGIVPPPISLINDERMGKAYRKVLEKDYTMLQDLIIEKYTKMHDTGENNESRSAETQEKI